jgi:hypothetical protein
MCEFAHSETVGTDSWRASRFAAPVVLERARLRSMEDFADVSEAGDGGTHFVDVYVR